MDGLVVLSRGGSRVCLGGSLFCTGGLVCPRERLDGDRRQKVRTPASRYLALFYGLTSQVRPLVLCFGRALVSEFLTRWSKGFKILQGGSFFIVYRFV